MDSIRELYDLRETLNREVKKANDKIDKANGELSAGDVEYIDRLTHALKSVSAVISMDEREEYSYENRGYTRDGRRSYDDGESSSRGRSVRRDSMGRYSRSGDMTDRLRELMRDAPDERTRREMQSLIEKMEQL